MKAYIAYGEKAILVIAYDQNPSKAMRKVAKKIERMSASDEWLNLTGLNVSYDDEGYYHIIATVSTTASNG